MEKFEPGSALDLECLVQLHRYAQVGQCANGVTHDINNLLGAAMAYAELAAFDENISADTRRMLGQIVDGVTKCSTLIKALTSMARRDRADINLAPPEKLLEEVLVLRDYELKMKQIKLELCLQESLQVIPVDLPKAKLALLNLLVNAQEAVQAVKEKQIRISAGKVDEHIYFEFWDSGGGLAPELRERAFEPLTSFWPEGEHLGLGLYTARKIAALHEGALTYDPDTGFRLTIKRENGLLRDL